MLLTGKIDIISHLTGISLGYHYRLYLVGGFNLGQVVEETTHRGALDLSCSASGESPGKS